MTDKIIKLITKSSTGEIDLHEYEYDTVTQSHTIPSDHYLSFDEIVNDLSSRMDTDTLNVIKNTNYEDLITFHLTLGMWIRNEYGLWHPNNPHIGEAHPDDYSFVAIQRFWYKLNDATFNLDYAMDILNND